MDPIDSSCPCPTCKGGTSRAFLHHIVTHETVAAHGAVLLPKCRYFMKLILTLAVTQHNITFQAQVMGRAREAIIAGTFPDCRLQPFLLG